MAFGIGPAPVTTARVDGEEGSPAVPSEIVVVGLDGSPNSKAAARWAMEESSLRGAKVEFVTAFGLLAPHHLPDRAALVTDREVAEACARMQAGQLADIPDHGVPVMTRTEHGDAPHVLLAAAEQADLLVLGARGHGGIAGLRLGSVSLHCIQRATCPVVVVPAFVADAGRTAPVVVGVDGSPVSRAALAAAAHEASLRSARVVVVHAVEWRPLGTDLVRPGKAQLVDWGRHLLTGMLDSVRAQWPNVVFDERVVPGHPAHVLREAGRTADLLVMGSRGHGQLAGLLVGSVSLHVLSHVHRPTMVVTS